MSDDNGSKSDKTIVGTGPGEYSVTKPKYDQRTVVIPGSGAAPEVGGKKRPTMPGVNVTPIPTHQNTVVSVPQKGPTQPPPMGPSAATMVLPPSGQPAP